MAAIDIGIGHDNNLAIAQLLNVVVLAKTSAQRRYKRQQLVVSQHAVDPRFFHVERLAEHRQHGLEALVACHRRRATGRVALDQENFGLLWIADGAIGQFAGQRSAVEYPLAPGQFARFACRLACAAGLHDLVDDPLGDVRVLFEVGTQCFGGKRIDDAFDFAVA